MALLTHSAETGVANGTAVSTGNSAAGDGSTTFTTASGTALTYSASAFRGAQGFTVNASTTNYAGWSAPPGATTAAAVRVYVRFGNSDANDQAFVSLRSSGGGTGFFHLLWAGPDGVINVLSDAGGAQGSTSPGTLTTGVWYRVEAGFTTATSSTGTMTLRVYEGDGDTPVASLDLTGANLGSGNVGTTRFGRTASTGGSLIADFDDVALQTGSDTLIGPSLVPNVPPTADAGADQVDIEPYTTVTLSGSDSDSDGTVVTRTWAQTAGTSVALSGASTATATFTAPGTIAGETLTFSYTVEDDGGDDATDSCSVTVLPVTERAAIGGVEVPMQIRET
jgi:hypothetical protein